MQKKYLPQGNQMHLTLDFHKYFTKISLHENKKATSKIISTHYTAIATKISTSYKNNMTLFGVKTLIIPLKKNLYWKPLKAWQKKNSSVYSSMGPGVDIFFPLLCSTRKSTQQLRGVWFIWFRLDPFLVEDHSGSRSQAGKQTTNSFEFAEMNKLIMHKRQ